MALYGTDSSAEQGARAALRGVDEMLRRLERLNRSLTSELSEPLRMGIGIHAGVAIVGTMGPPSAPNFSAIGDAINIAARLEAETKRLDVPVVLSEDVARLAGLDVAGLIRDDVEIRGRSGRPIAVYGVTGGVTGGLTERPPGGDGHGPPAADRRG